MKSFNENDLLLETSQLLVIDLVNELINVDSEFLETISIEPEPGLYIAGDIDPFYKLTRNHKLHKLQGDEFYNELDSFIKTIKEEDSKIKLDEVLYKRIKHLITNKPTVPASSLKIMTCVIMNRIHHLCKYTRGSLAKDAYPYIKPEYRTEDNIDFLETIFDSLIIQILKLIGNDKYHIYFVELKKSVLYIEKTVDFRIYDWYRMKNEYEPTNNIHS